MVVWPLARHRHEWDGHCPRVLVGSPMIFYAKDKLHLADTNHMVKIGDSCIDIEEGKNAGCLLNIGITTGAQTEIQLMEAKPDYIVHSLTEMLEILEK